MASTYTNTDLTYLANEALSALVQPLDEINLFSTKISAENYRKGDSVKVYVHSQTEDASAFDRASNNYGSVDDDATTGVDVTMNLHLKKTTFVPDEEFGRIDEVTKVKGIAKAVAKLALKNVYDTILVADFPTVAFTGLASTFAHDDVVDLMDKADEAGWEDRALVMTNAYSSNLKKDGELVTLRNAIGPVGSVLNQYEELEGFKPVRSTVLASSTGATGENLGGFITDGSGLAVACGLQRPASGQGTTEYAQVVDDETGMGLGLRRFYDDAEGGFKYTAEILFGVKVLRPEGLQRIITA